QHVRADHGDRALREVQHARCQKSAAEATFGKYSSLVPDLSKIDRGKLEVSGDQAMLGAPLALMAVNDLADEIATAVVNAMKDGREERPPGQRVLVTTSRDLVADDAVFQDVRSSLRGLNKWAKLLKKSASDLPSGTREIAPASAASIAASMAPSLIGMFSSHRTLATSSVAADDAVASMAVAASLARNAARLRVALDDFRTIPEFEGGVLDSIQNLRKSSMELSRTKTELQSNVEAAAVVANIGAAVEMIDGFLASVTAITASGRSALTSAMLQEQLHASGDAFTHVLLIKSCPGTAQQLVEDRPMMMKDIVSVVSATGIAYSLLEASSGDTVAGGALAASRHLHGKLGRELIVDKVERMDLPKET
ncbi:hypothetical protein, partial [Streptomyces sp. NPDC000229]|uniref:hypothetical protein n=1 Tax=Streptomyces sp. NPDC000229 TaxID=3154247 RepID=UPI003329FE1E